MTSPQSLLFVFGLGYSALQLSAQLRPAGWQVAGTVRTAAKAADLKARGIEAAVWTGEGPVDVPAGAHWLITLPPGRQGCPAAPATLAPSSAMTSTTLQRDVSDGVRGGARGGACGGANGLEAARKDQIGGRVETVQSTSDQTIVKGGNGRARHDAYGRRGGATQPRQGNLNGELQGRHDAAHAT